MVPRIRNKKPTIVTCMIAFAIYETTQSIDRAKKGSDEYGTEVSWAAHLGGARVQKNIPCVSKC